MLLVVVEGETFGFDLGLGVTVHVLVGKRFGLVGAVVMAGRVNAEAAQMHEAQQRLVLAGLQQGSQGIDVDRAVIFNRPPITDLRGAMNHDLRSVKRRLQKFGVGEIAAQNRGAEVLQQGCVACGPCNRANGYPSRLARFRHMATDKPRCPGNEISSGHHTERHSGR